MRATDKAIIEIDEQLSRDTFAGEIRAAIDEEKARIKARLSVIHQERIQALLAENETRLREIPTRQLIESGL